jgi:hypothetical protein
VKTDVSKSNAQVSSFCALERSLARGRMRQSELRSTIDARSNSPPKSPVSPSQDDLALHRIVRSPRLQPRKFSIGDTKRLLQQYRHMSDVSPAGLDVCIRYQSGGQQCSLSVYSAAAGFPSVAAADAVTRCRLSRLSRNFFCHPTFAGARWTSFSRTRTSLLYCSIALSRG